MIGYLRGSLASVGAESILLDVKGVGYVVQVSTSLLAKLPPLGEDIALLIETMVGEDFIRLYGFLSEVERDWFKLLLTVQGVGAKASLAILGVVGADNIARAIALQDKALITRAPGIGAKIALRILTELKDKTPKSLTTNVSLTGNKGKSNSGEKSVEIPSAESSQAAQDAISALINLGYDISLATKAVYTVEKTLEESERSVQTLIKLGLKELTNV